MDIFLVNQDNPNAQSLCEKLAAQTKPGAIIPLTTGEMELCASPSFQHLGYGNSENSNIVEVKKGGSYIFVCDENTNIDDVMLASDRLKLDSAIIRTGK